MIERVGIVAKIGLHAAAGHLVEVARWLEARGVQAVFEADTAKLADLGPERTVVSRDELPLRVDLILVLGGDGTLLAMADKAGDSGRDVPILGANFGSLGFLTEVTLADLYTSLESALAGTAAIDERLMLRACIARGGQPIVDRVLLNDVVITRGALSRMIDLSVSVGGHFVARFNADGLIVASPTGSTAYNLSAGGPIVHPAVDAIVVTPIAPHILTNRPVVIPASAEVVIQPIARDAAQKVFLTLDGQVGFQLQADDIVRVSRAERRIRLIHAPTRDYFQVLRQKLKWAER
jgi:NAD+ kinase